MSGPPIVVLLGGILGVEFAPSPSFSTLPVSLLIVGVACATIPSSLLMRKIGRRKGFILGSLVATIAALIAAIAVYRSNFALFCTATLFIGASGAFVQQYRFAAAETVSPKFAGRAVSFLMVSGIIAAFLGPQIANLTQDSLPMGLYIGSFVALAGLYFLVFVIMVLFYRDDIPVHLGLQGLSRPLSRIIRQPKFLLAVFCAAVGYGMMSFIMTATPVQMHTLSGFFLQSTTLVIQSHIIAMYLPSVFTGLLIERFGLLRILLSGMLILLTCVLLGVISRLFWEYWGALVLLGIGWNLLFVGGTLLLTQSYSPVEKFKAQAVNDFVIFSFQSFASFTAGVVLFASNWSILNMIIIPILALLLFTLIVNRKHIEVQTEIIGTIRTA